MTERTIRADEVKVGQTVTGIVAKGQSRWRKRRVEEHQDIRKTSGRWPTVIRVDYWKRGEDDRPTVYLELSDERGCSYPLAPDDHVTIQEG